MAAPLARPRGALPDPTTEFCELSAGEQELLLGLQQSILEAVALGKDARAVVDDVCRLQEQLLPNAVGSVMLLDERHLLNVYAAPSIPPAGTARLNGLRPGPKAGSCGNAIYREEAVFVADTLTDPRWENLRPLAVDFGLMACWSIPIRGAGEKPIGTFALSSFERRAPSPFHRKMLEIGASIIGIVLERSRQADHIRLLNRAFDSSNEAIMITDAEGRIISVNQTFTATTGYTAPEVLGRNPRLLSSGRHDQSFYRTMWQSIGQLGHWQGEIWNRRRNGEIYPQWINISTIHDDAGQLTHYLGVLSDITERKEAQEYIDFLSHHDALTGLPNRLLLKDRLSQAMAQADRHGSKVALLLLDIDNFKTINDTLGHGIGDELLQAVAARLRKGMRESDTISRQGGDEFLLILPDAPDSQAIGRCMDELLNRLHSPFALRGQELTVSASIGAAIYPDDGENFETLFSKADMAMYNAKEAGRNTGAFFDARMNADARSNLRLHNDLARALERRELVLHYQPQVDLESGAIIGAEALIRWQHPEHGLLPPGQFIPLAEESGLIVPIGEWVLREACRQAAAWQNQGLPPLVMAVNLSALQFKRGSLVLSVAEALAETGLEPGHLELELTESILIKDTENVLQTVQALRGMGIRLSVDDFGTGYSSLAYLKRFAVHKLKIDRSFVHNMADNPDDAAIVRAIIQMAKSLNLSTIAEGVEDPRLPDLLRQHGCTEAQGFLFARPLPADELARRLEQPRP